LIIDQIDKETAGYYMNWTGYNIPDESILLYTLLQKSLMVYFIMRVILIFNFLNSLYILEAEFMSKKKKMNLSVFIFLVFLI
jgi:hypothetical protein